MIEPQEAGCCLAGRVWALRGGLPIGCCFRWPANDEGLIAGITRGVDHVGGFPFALSRQKRKNWAVGHQSVRVHPALNHNLNPKHLKAPQLQSLLSFSPSPRPAVSITLSVFSNVSILHIRRCKSPRRAPIPPPLLHFRCPHIG